VLEPWSLLETKGFIKKRYRKFDIKIKGTEQDDFAMLKEVLSRRFKRAILEKGNYLTLPDLILIDGGKGTIFLS
jgi:excinuclease ABC subunit C